MAPNPTPTTPVDPGPGYTIQQAEAGLKAEIDAAFKAGKISKAEYDKAMKSLAASAAGVADPQAAIAGNPPNISKTIKGQIPLPVNPISTVGDLIKAIGNPNTWIRVGEVVVGVVCIGVGLSAMTKANPVAKTAKTAAKAAVL